LTLEDLLVDLGTMDMHPDGRNNTKFHLITIQLENAHGDVITDSDDFAYGAA